ncbi:MFS transporter [Dactylosporangium sp. NBC_01737]|uniref:MFS transporter n=1 Tax=Dactylosporangium sp. NBC_01737 TaxID=2975959 RepID=UPI002E0D418E|nr:MFS transporter [Dactylosporangium sp. NBC_01737]
MTLPVWVLLVGTLVNTVGSFLMLFLTLYLTQKGFSPFHAGLALGAWGAGRIAGAFVGGTIADRVGYRFAMALSMFSTAALITALIGAANLGNPWLVVLAALAAALLNGVWRPPAQAMITEATPPGHLVMVMAFWRLAFNLGVLVAPLLGALLSRVSWDLLFWVEAGSSALFGVLALTALPAVAAPASTPAAPSAPAPPTGYGRVLRDGAFVLFLFALLVNGIVYIQGPATLPLHLNGLGYRPEVFGALVSLNALVVICLEVPVTRLTQRMRPRTAVAAGMALTGIGLSLWSVELGIAGLVVATLVWTMGEVVASPSMFAYPGQVAPPHLRARYIAASTVANQIGYSVGPVLGTALWAGVGGAVFWICGALAAVAVLAVLAGVRTVDTVKASTPAEPESVAASTDADPKRVSEGAAVDGSVP